MSEVTPRVPDEFSTGSIGDPNPRQQELKSLHYRLMAIYVYAMEQVAAVPPPSWVRKLRTTWRSLLRVDREDNTWQYRRRPITRALVESHVKAKTRELRRAYAQIEQSVLSLDTTGGFQGWLQDTQDSLARFSATLTAMSFVRRVIIALWPLAVALAAVGTVWHTIFGWIGKPGALDTSIWLVITVFGYVGGGLALAFHRKREFFLKPLSISSAWAENPQDDPVGGKITAPSVYEAEDELFGCVGKSKRREPAIDAYLGGIVFLAFAMIQIPRVPGADRGPWLALHYWPVASGAVIGIVMILIGLRRTRR